MTTTALPTDGIAAFAAAVREQLSDLPPDEVDDIVDGLESDLAEQAAERGEGFELPDAAAYAAELRQAAGLPERPQRASAHQALGAQLRGLRDRTVRGIRSSRAGAWLFDLLLALRPVWWLARGWMLYVAIAAVFGLAAGWAVVPVPTTGASMVVLALAVLLSIQWGRGRWLPRAWLRAVMLAISTVAVLMLPFVVGIAIGQVESWRNAAHTGYAYSSAQPGLAVDGERVRNIFAYDSDGNPLADVQLFDQDGNPLTTVGAQSSEGTIDDYYAWGGGPVPVAVTMPGRAPVWNVFPLEEIPAGVDNASPGLAQPAAPPFAQVPSLQRLLAASPTPTPGVDTTTGVPSPTASPETPSPRATADEGADAGSAGADAGVDASTDADADAGADADVAAEVEGAGR